MSVGLDANWRLNTKEFYSTPYITCTNTTTQPQMVNLQTEESDSFVFNKTSEGCTDGKDDGKIGFFSAVGNAAKGVGKTIVNGVKGMFTNKEGKFSLGKTLLTVATAAACIAFPAVGLAACVVGGTMGVIQVGKGIYDAATAETDAEAKQAWQNIGGGAFTVAASVAGAKASVKAVQNSAGSASALAQLDDTASATQKLSALGKDMVTSTKNSAKNVAAGAKNLVSTAKAKAKTAANDAKVAISEAKTAYNDSAIGKAKAALDAAKASGNADDIAAEEAALKSATKDAAKAAANQAKDKAANVAQNAKDIAKNVKSKITKDNASKLWSNIKANIKNINVKDLGNKLSGTAKNILNELQSGSSSYAQVVNKYGFDNVAQVLEYVAGTAYAGKAV